MGTGKRMDDSEVAAWNTMRRQENELAALRERVAEAEGLLRRGFAGSRHTHIVIGWDKWERDVEAWLAGASPSGETSREG